ncbi:S-layer homology domain-containing protein [Paenibacillus barcinonensis]|uniref:S-layer homology domain-containing protein n=1 Tax=Paenibacillus barcinonensis TaxID=198119 RepID=UPI001C0FEB90|nr:S-layer homology domain-containing protein [Paenibacillus barcinonensis]MBU5352864.1 S-layer homology domain-containing protein [Paenibacillus barcinonensis]
MFFKRITQKVNIIILVMSMLCMSVEVAYGEDVTSDIEGHWAQPTITKWHSKGLIKGYSDGSFRPNNVIRRGEFMSLINRQFQFNEPAEINFSDLSASDWTYIEAQKAVKAGYIQGYKDQTIRSYKPITRQEVAVIVADLLKLPSNEKAALAFKDSSEFLFWSKGAIGAVFSKNIITGYTNGAFKPTSPITRAEAVVILDKAFASIHEQNTEIQDGDNTVVPSPPTASTINSNSANIPNGSGSYGSNTGLRTSTIVTTKGVKAIQGKSQVITLTITNGVITPGFLRATFTDGVNSVAVYVELGGNESNDEVASKVARAFENKLLSWNVDTQNASILFTAANPSINNNNVKATVESVMTGVVSRGSTITVPGNVENNNGTVQVVTLAVENGATASGSYHIYFTDGGAPISKNISITGIESAVEVASKIATAFGTSITGWSVTSEGAEVHFTSQQPGANNENIRVYALEASGVGAPSSELTVPGNPNTNTSQVVTLRLPNSESDGGPIGVKFTDGVSAWTVHVNMLGSPESGSELADKIATAFGTTIPDWDVSASGTKVIFTAKLPAENKSKALARLSGLNTGIGMPDSKITTAGTEPAPDIAQVVTLAVENGATASGSYHIYFTDGGAPISKNISITGIESAVEVASKIATAFGTSITGWSVTSEGAEVHFTSQQPGANNENIRVYALEASGVGAPLSELTVPGNPNTNTSQVVTLRLPNSESDGGPIGVKFTDGVSAWTVHVNMLGSPESGSELADKIATAFGTTIPDWNVSASGTKVIFTAKLPAENKSKALARLSGLNTGIGMLDSKITTTGAVRPGGVQQIVTLVIDSGATATGNIAVKYTDGDVTIVKNVSLVGTESAEEVALKIANVFEMTLTDWYVSSIDNTVKFIAKVASNNNPNLSVTIEESTAGIGLISSSITTPGSEFYPGVKQVVTLKIDSGTIPSGIIKVVFRDGINEVVKHVSLSGTETLDVVADRIGSAFGQAIIGWNVSSIGHNVVFTANMPTDNKPDIKVAVYKE